MLRELYSPFLRTEKPFLVMSPESAEMTKYVANAMLATKISFINEDRQPVRADGRGHQRRPPRHRPRQPHRLRLSVSRRRLRRQLLSQGRAGAGRRWRGTSASSRASWTRSTKSTTRQKTVLLDKIERALRRQVERSDDRHLGTGVQAPHRRHSRGPGPGADRPLAGAGGQGASPRSRGDRKTSRPAMAIDWPTRHSLRWPWPGPRRW